MLWWWNRLRLGKTERRGFVVFHIIKLLRVDSYITLQKEAKRAAKLQSQSNQPPPAATVPSISTTTTIVHPQPLHAPARLTSTLKPGAGTPRTGSTTSNVSIPTGAGANGAPRPISAVPRSGSAVPRPGSAVKPVTTSQGQVGTPVTTRTITPMEVDQQRGKKREREESTSLVNGTHANGVVNGYVNGGANAISNGLPQQTSVASNSKAGTVSARPRPIKKQRMVHILLVSQQTLTET